MNKEQIDELLDIIISEDQERIFSYFEITEETTIEEGEEIFKKIMEYIEAGDYEYFKEFLKIEEYRPIILEFFSYAKPKNIKELIKDKENYKLEPNEIVSLIIATKDPNYIEACIEDKREEFGLDEPHIVDLIKSTEDPNYIEACIEDKREEFSLEKCHILDLIKSTKDPDYIKKWIENEDKRKEIISYYFDILDLIKSTKDPDYIKEWIENKDKQKGVIINTFYIVDLIKFIKDPDYIKECIEKREKLGLTDNNVRELIQAIENKIEILENYKELGFSFDFINFICNEMKPQDFLKNILFITELFKDEEFYEEFIKQYLGEVDLDKDKNPRISEDLKLIIFNIEDEDKARKIKENLPQIIAKWDQIREQIQYKKANSIKNDSLEIKFSINEILLALQVLNKRMPQTVSEVEFENTPGSDEVGVDTQYTTNSENAVERAYELSRMMDENNGEKKFPDFSVENEKMILKVLHPQDKSSILLGFDAACCFRPNGEADNKGENPYSLVQYVTTTPYGGVIRVDSKENDEVYMGSPILRSGNCLMFHSYESACSDTKNAEQVNGLLDEAAIKAIEESKGQIKAVFITDLHTGSTRLDRDKRLTIGSYFKPYFEEEYEEYRKMYTNLDCNNVVLAINVDGKILIGEQIRQWFEKECSGDEEIFKEKLGLQLGKVEDTYEYPRRNVFYEIAIDNKPIVDKFSDRYKGLKEERHLLALFNKKKQLESKKELSKEDEETLRVIEEELEQYKESEKYIEYSELSAKKIREKLETNREEIFKVFSGEDIYMLAEVYGITREEIEKIAEDKVRAQQPKEDVEGKESTIAKKLKSRLISQIKESNNPELLKLISKVAKEEITEEDMQLLQEVGIETEEYEKVCIRKEKIVDEKQRQADIVRVQKERLLKDESVVEAIVADKIFGDVTQEEIDAQISEDLIKTVRTYIYDYYVSQDADGIITEAEKTRINNKIQELHIDNMISQCIDNNFESTEWTQRISEEFGLDVKSEYNKISSNPAKLKSKVQKSKLAKLKSDVSIGIRKKERIEKLQETIGYSEEQGEKKDFERVVYGNDWFIGFGDGKPIIHMNPDISDLDKEDLKVVLRKEIDKAKEAKEGKKTISMVEMKKVVSEVSLEDKKVGIDILEEILEELEKGDN